MSIHIQVLGKPGEDNASLFRIDSGSAIHRLLFDCGEKCLDTLSMSDIQSIDHLFFSHFHMDHVCGFDTFFRHNYNRPDRPVMIWGPPGSIEVIHHRMRGFAWNLHQDQPGEWVVNEVTKTEIKTARFYTLEAFSEAHIESLPYQNGMILEQPDYSITVKFLDHGSISSLAFRVDEPIRENIDPARLAALGLKPGPWIRDLKETISEDGTIEIDGEPHSISELRNSLITETPGKSAAYLTDFILEPGSEAWAETCEWIKGVDTLVCEAQYRELDNGLAGKNHHMTARRVAQMAAEAGVGNLVIQHVSRRYDIPEWEEMLSEAKAVFPETSFPEHWQLT